MPRFKYFPKIFLIGRHVGILLARAVAVHVFDDLSAPVPLSPACRVVGASPSARAVPRIYRPFFSPFIVLLVLVACRTTQSATSFTLSAPPAAISSRSCLFSLPPRFFCFAAQIIFPPFHLSYVLVHVVLLRFIPPGTRFSIGR